MGTRVTLTRSGGLAGLSMVASVDVEELPDPARARVRAALGELDFDAPPAPPAEPHGADTYQYDVVVTNGGRRSLTAHDPVRSPGLRALLDVLLPLARPE